MSGQYVVPPSNPATGHPCAPPMSWRRSGTTTKRWADDSAVGAVWQCDCGQFWFADWDWLGSAIWKKVSDAKAARLVRRHANRKGLV